MKIAARFLLLFFFLSFDQMVSLCTHFKSAEIHHRSKFYGTMQQMHDVQPITKAKQTLKFA